MMRPKQLLESYRLFHVQRWLVCDRHCASLFGLIQMTRDSGNY
jgi:hypothetical protein